MEPSDANLTDFQQTLLRWWRDNARSYPWRRNRSPYATAIAEIMLRRTRAEQVVPVYERFLETYPTVEAAARAEPSRIRDVMYSLGLAWRADSMVEFLKQAHARFGNELPADVELLRTLPGVGDYVGAAIACFAGNEPVALIDTNVVRVLGRIFGVDTRGEARRRREMRELAARTVPQERPADYHYALLDFAARVCLARTPRCEVCPFREGARCDYYRTVVGADEVRHESEARG
jgi:A/G-specific adenine glycosylase